MAQLFATGIYTTIWALPAGPFCITFIAFCMAEAISLCVEQFVILQIFADIAREVVMEDFLVDLDDWGFLLLGVFGSRHGMALLSEVR